MAVASKGEAINHSGALIDTILCVFFLVLSSTKLYGPNP